MTGKRRLRPAAAADLTLSVAPRRDVSPAGGGGDSTEQRGGGAAVGVGADLGGLHALEKSAEDFGAHESADDAGAAEGERL